MNPDAHVGGAGITGVGTRKDPMPVLRGRTSAAQTLRG